MSLKAIAELILRNIEFKVPEDSKAKSQKTTVHSLLQLFSLK